MAYLNECTRVYRPGGMITHLLPPGDTPAAGRPESLCGMRERAWLGADAQHERDKAASLPACARCKAAAEEART